MKTLERTKMDEPSGDTRGRLGNLRCCRQFCRYRKVRANISSWVRGGLERRAGTYEDFLTGLLSTGRDERRVAVSVEKKNSDSSAF